MRTAALCCAVFALSPVAQQPPSHPKASTHVSVDLRVTRTVPGVRLRVAVSDAVTRITVRRLALIDGKPMHIFVVGGPGLRVFRHEQPEPQPDGSFAADVALGESGLYMAFAGFHPEGGSPQLFQQAFTTGSLLAARVDDPVDEPHASNGLQASMDASKVRSGIQSTLTFDLSDQATGEPASNLEVLFGASAQLFIVSADLTEGRQLDSIDTSHGPRVTFKPVFPRPGRYKMWLQVLRDAKTATVPFLVDVP
jgi:hypothetical protein